MRLEDITYQEKYNELRLDISHPKSKGKTYIFVEGDSDIKLFRKFFNIEICKVERIPGGNNKLEECVSNLMNIYPLIIGIRDADFIHLKNEKYDLPNMFLTDYHDIETTMISQNIILNALVFEFTNLPKDEHINLRDNILFSIRKIGYLKLLNDIKNFELDFSVGFQDLISFANQDINFNEYLRRVISKSKNAKVTDENLLQKEVEKLYELNPDLLQLTNGHDLLKAFAKYFREEEKIKGLSDEDLARAFRMMFTVEHFSKTQLYSSIKEWEETNDIKILLQASA